MEVIINKTINFSEFFCLDAKEYIERRDDRREVDEKSRGILALLTFDVELEKNYTATCNIKASLNERGVFWINQHTSKFVKAFIITGLAILTLGIGGVFYWRASKSLDQKISVAERGIYSSPKYYEDVKKAKIYNAVWSIPTSPNNSDFDITHQDPHDIDQRHGFTSAPLSKEGCIGKFELMWMFVKNVCLNSSALGIDHSRFFRIQESGRRAGKAAEAQDVWYDLTKEPQLG